MLFVFTCFISLLLALLTFFSAGVSVLFLRSGAYIPRETLIVEFIELIKREGIEKATYMHGYIKKAKHVERRGRRRKGWKEREIMQGRGKWESIVKPIQGIEISKNIWQTNDQRNQIMPKSYIVLRCMCFSWVWTRFICRLLDATNIHLNWIAVMNGSTTRCVSSQKQCMQNCIELLQMKLLAKKTKIFPQMPSILSILLQEINKYSDKWLECGAKEMWPNHSPQTNAKTKTKTTRKFYKPPAGATNTMKWAKISACIDA